MSGERMTRAELQAIRTRIKEGIDAISLTESAIRRDALLALDELVAAYPVDPVPLSEKQLHMSVEEDGG